jgi:small conductance mechanosensitive channel
MDRAFAVGVDVAGAMPGVEIRANRYLPILRRVLGFVVLFLAVVAVGEAWGLNALAWLASDWSRDVFSRLFAIGAIVLVALLVIEAIGGVIRRFLDARDAKGNVVMRSARMRTLLPLLKNCVVVIVTAIAAFTALSELGVDIGPLLAGAGVVGLAVGFGAQTLVKDVITGAFILFENQIAVGDVVDLGGTSGVVEGMTIRTVTLRDGAGSVITIPFGDVVRVTNMTRDFAFAVLDVNVDYREDPERVSEVLREVDKAMRADPAVARLVLAPIEVMGVSSLGESGVAIRARVMTQAGQQWDIQRRYLGAIKRRFDEAGIRIPFPQRTIHVKHEGLPVGEDSSSAAIASAARDIG